MDSRPTCSCGHDRYHHWARASLSYGGGGWFALLNGASGTPRQIVFRCANHPPPPYESDARAQWW